MRRYTSAGQGTLLICLSVIRLLHALPGSHLPPLYRRKVARTAILVDTVQILMGVVACVLPAVTTRAELSDEGLMLILAAFAMLNVVANVWFSMSVARTEEQAKQELENEAEHGDRAAEAALHRLSDAENAVPCLDAGGFAVHDVTGAHSDRCDTVVHA